MYGYVTKQTDKFIHKLKSSVQLAVELPVSGSLRFILANLEFVLAGYWKKNKKNNKKNNKKHMLIMSGSSHCTSYPVVMLSLLVLDSNVMRMLSN